LNITANYLFSGRYEADHQSLGVIPHDTSLVILIVNLHVLLFRGPARNYRL